MKAFALGLMAVLGAAAAPAVAPSTWTHTTEADFAEGEFDQTVVSSLGEITLGRKLEILLKPQHAPQVVSALAVDGETLYVAGGSNNVIYRIRADQAEAFAEPPGAIVTALCVHEGKLLAGTGGGEGAGIYRIDGKGKAELLFADEQADFFWAIVPAGKFLYVATGPHAAVYAIDQNGIGRVVYQADDLAKNILCLALSQEGLLYAGTDQDGLVVEIDPSRQAARVILDAEEQEIAAIVTDEVGGVFAATADVAKAAAEGQHEPNAEASGKATEAPVPAPTTQPGSQPAGAFGNATSQPAQQAAEEPAPDEPETAPTPSRRRPVRPAKRPAGKAGGNAVYYVQPDGLSQAIFRRPVTILAMVRLGEKLILGTGNGGSLYAVSRDGDEITQLADTDAKQVSALAIGPDGRILFGTSNEGSVGSLSDALAEEGTYTSEVLDAEQPSRWGTLRVRSSLPQGAVVTAQTRSGNVREPHEKTWSPWSPPVQADGGYLPITSPVGRFLQYRLNLRADAGRAPTVQQVEIVYQLGNLAPIVSAVSVTPSASRRDARGNKDEGPRAFRHLSIQAEDPNGDELVYEIAFRQVGQATWVRIAEDLPEPKFVWETRTVNDGVYELKVTACDSPGNPPASALRASRISEPVVVDNTAPVIVELTAGVTGTSAKVNGKARDATSRIVTLHYAVDSQEDWVAVLPADGIADSNQEDFAFDLDDLEPGSHRIAVRVEDLLGNTGYAAIAVTVGE